MSGDYESKTIYCIGVCLYENQGEGRGLSNSSLSQCPLFSLGNMDLKLLKIMDDPVKGEVYPEMKLSQSIELFLTKRMPPIRNPSDVCF